MNESLNRAFLYGESVFTTLRMVDGVLRDWDLHFERLKKGVEYVYGPFSDAEDWFPLLKNRLEASCQAESGDRVIRFSVYRHQERGLRRTGLLSASDLKIHMSATPYEAPRTEGRSVALRTCPALLRPSWWPAFLKAGSYLDVILAQKIFLKETDDDLLFLSAEDRVLESSVANVFVVRHNRLYTAPTGPNVLDGIMRKKVLSVAHHYFDQVIEDATTVDQLHKADGIFGTNSVRGPFLIRSIDGAEVRATTDFLTRFEALRERVLA